MTVQQHTVTMENRERLSLTGVEDVADFSDEKVELHTLMGAMRITGKELSINKLDTQEGKLNINGEIACVEYTAIKKKTGLLEGLFK